MSNEMMPSESTWAGRPGDTVQSLFSLLRRDILDGTLPAGERIRESVLAANMGVSRAPMREALRLIEQNGLIEKTPNRSYVVASFTRGDIVELATLRATLEVMAARLALQRLDTAEILSEAIAPMEQAAGQNDLKALAAADRFFHGTLVKCSGHSRLLKAYHALQDQIELALLDVQRRERSAAKMVDRHRRLVALAPDPDAFVDALKRHIREGMGIADYST